MRLRGGTRTTSQNVLVAHELAVILSELRDEGEAYARKLSEAGVPTTAIRYLGTIHAFTVLNVITETPAPGAAIAQATGILRHIFANGG